jgi:hypothetical protein
VPDGTEVKQESLVLVFVHQDHHMLFSSYGCGDAEFEQHIAVHAADVGNDHICSLYFVPDLSVDDARADDCIGSYTFEFTVKVGADRITSVLHEPIQIVIYVLRRKGAHKEASQMIWSAPLDGSRVGEDFKRPY